ncbi:unnamed protein product [Mycena citricolor]|uniref:Uncharacterized protein n=1 Tax=Mycena citricolor TaxID=2018698 RepID=A0AAD2HCL8_9AGAR|nr:unnamed protein product [Mycena citricolor]
MYSVALSSTAAFEFFRATLTPSTIPSASITSISVRSTGAEEDGSESARRSRTRSAGTAARRARMRACRFERYRRSVGLLVFSRGADGAAAPGKGAAQARGALAPGAGSVWGREGAEKTPAESRTRQASSAESCVELGAMSAEASGPGSGADFRGGGEWNRKAVSSRSGSGDSWHDGVDISDEWPLPLSQSDNGDSDTGWGFSKGRCGAVAHEGEEG